MDPQQMTDAMREAVAKALHPYVTADDHETACTAILDAVKTRLLADLPAIMEHAAKQPAAQNALMATIMVPLLQELEDGLNDDQTDPKTHPTYLPGLRRDDARCGRPRERGGGPGSLPSRTGRSSFAI